VACERRCSEFVSSDHKGSRPALEIHNKQVDSIHPQDSYSPGLWNVRKSEPQTQFELAGLRLITVPPAQNTLLMTVPRSCVLQAHMPECSREMELGRTAATLSRPLFINKSWQHARPTCSCPCFVNERRRCAWGPFSSSSFPQSPPTLCASRCHLTRPSQRRLAALEKLIVVTAWWACVQNSTSPSPRW